jgi:hypothetical protein
MRDLNTLLNLDFASKDKMVRMYSNELCDEIGGFVNRYEV